MEVTTVHLEQAANQKIEIDPGFRIQLDIKRLDLIHPEINGNKWFKLKYNLEKVLAADHKTILTFGGPYSNHIFSVASAGKEFGIKTIGVIRGEEPTEWSPTLLHAKECGMRLEFINRLAYAEKDTEDFVGWLHEEYGSFHLVPEGGSNYLGVNGCMEILTQEDKKNYDVICCTCGTGATLAGILLSLDEHQRVIGFPALKGGDFLMDEVIKHIKYFLMSEELANEFRPKIEMMIDYHFGGYGKWDQTLIDFILQFDKQYDIPLDQVYTGKMLYGLMDLFQKNYFAAGTRILAIHSGGLQGRLPALIT